MGLDDKYDVLDEGGHKTGELLELWNIHAQELWHEVTNVWVKPTR